jgi:hypothetical protein
MRIRLSLLKKENELSAAITTDSIETSFTFWSEKDAELFMRLMEELLLEKKSTYMSHTTLTSKEWFTQSNQ